METGKGTEHCAICGMTLQYETAARELSCTVCGRKENAHIVCPSGHYLCESCHGAEAKKMVREMSLLTLEKDPLRTAVAMFSQPMVPMLGCEHAYIAAGAFMSALKNQGLVKVTNEDTEEAFRRLERQAAGGYCGLTGVCGIVPAMGACISILYGSKCGKDMEQRLTMEAATRVASEILGLTGPSCCKAYALAGINVAVDFLKEASGISLPVEDRAPKCSWSSRHPHGCRREKCPYFDPASLSSAVMAKPAPRSGNC